MVFLTNQCVPFLMCVLSCSNDVINAIISLHLIVYLITHNKRGSGDAPLPHGSNFFHFHAVLGQKLAKKYVGAPTLEVGASNPGNLGFIAESQLDPSVFLLE